MSGKSFTYVEMDLDLYRVTRFEDAKAGEPVRNWALQAGVTDVAVAGAIQPSFPSGRGLDVTRSASGLRSVLQWNVTPAIRDVSAVALLRSPTATRRLGIALRATAAASLTGYALELEGSDARLLKVAAGIDSVLFDSIAFPVAQDDDVWMLFDAVNIAGPAVLLRGKVWRGALADEPSLFMVFAEDSTAPFLAPGIVGVIASGEITSTRCGHFRARSLFGSVVETIRHAMPANYLPLQDVPAIPDVLSVSLNPPMISLGADLGKRAQLTVAFKDHPGADLGELTGSGSHWGKFRARQLFRRGQPLRLVRGMLGEDFDDMERRHYVLESFNGPNRDGSFTVIAQDVLKFADNDRAQAPRLSNGFLLAGIDAVTTSATMAPSGIGNAEYPTAGAVSIGGEEICTYTRAGDALTLTRGQFGTPAAAHAAEDRVQVCLTFTAQTPAAIANALLTQYAGVPSSYIPLAEWEAECATHLQRLYGRVIAEPTGVNKLLSELIEQAGLAMWPDEVANEIRMQVLRGIPTTAFLWDETNTLAGSIQPQEQPSKQITQVWTYYGVRNPLESLEETNNYRSSRAKLDTEGESLNGQAIIRKIFGTWIPAFAADTAERVNDIQIGRFSRPPRRIPFAVMRGSGVPDPELGGGYRIAWQGNQDEAGAPTVAPIQVTRVNAMADRFEVEAEEMLFKQFDPADLQDRVITIDSPINNVHLPSLHNSIFPAATPADVTAGVTLTVIINQGVLVGSNSTGGLAFNVGEVADWPAGFAIAVEIHGRIQGAGGRGADGDGSGGDGAPGGKAFQTRVPVTVNNLSEIWGGAGGGGGAGSVSGLDALVGGGGGCGQVPGAAGSGAPGAPPASPGTTESGGAGGDSPGQQGGSGGGPGQAGNPGNGLVFFGAGGAPGSAIDGVSLVTFANVGDIRGPQIN